MGKFYDNARRPARTGKKITVGRVVDLPPGRGAVVELNDGAELALFNNGGKFYAVENFCPHKGLPLADGFLRGSIVECRHHGWKFDAATGECLNKPRCTIEAYEVLIEEEMIKILI
jgi:nitrite reductase/ring-hydroxylating ferredoxin subunit